MVKEQIGNALLYRRDADVLQEPDDGETRRLCDIAGRYGEAEYKTQITGQRSWTAMYQLAESRGNVIEWMEIPRHAKVLELGAGCGTITSVLLNKGAQVTCQEENVHYCRINAKRHSPSEMLAIYAVPFAECEPELADDYDLAVLIGVREFIMDPEMLLNKLRRHLKPEGVLVLAVENKFGLKYWAGNKEPYTHRYFAGLENAGVRLLSQNRLKALLSNAGFQEQEFYYPYPDYRFAQDIYSDRHLPQKGDLNYNIANYEDDRMLVFDEQKVFDSIIEEGQFPFFSNSYLCLAGNGNRKILDQEIIYARYASDRSREYAVRTDIMDTKVCKRPLYPEGAAHVAHMAEAYERLCRQYVDTDLKFNECRLVLAAQQNGTGTSIPDGSTRTENQPAKTADIYAEFERIHAQALQAQAEQAVASGQIQTVFAILQRMVHDIRNGKGSRPFTKTEEFTHVFGEISGLEALQAAVCSEVSDIDLILPNIFVDADDRWHVIDYEWTFFFPVPQNFIIYRTLFFLNHENPDHAELSMEKLLAAAGIPQEEAAVYAQMEAGFQRFVTGGQIPYREMVNLLGRKYADIVQLKEDFDFVARQNEILKGRGIWKIARVIRKKLTGNRTYENKHFL